ncbi:hypothetical protein B0H11DRAFT_2184278 [Mycena galericulata]|nr:hypothetical protein B0H11DRAFT_2184278 [Mycena galericulata]
MGLSDFPLELLTKIFLHVSYKSLLSVMAVCVQWNAIVTDDPSLSVQMFRKLSKVYVEPGCHERMRGRRSDSSAAEGAEPIRLHPAVQKASYVMGADVSSVKFYTGDRNRPFLDGLAIANDFISIPVVTMVTIQIPDRGFAPNAFKVKVKNSKGVKIIDIFTRLQIESNRRIMTERYGVMTRAEFLGDHLHYEGLSAVVRTGLGCSAELYLGS